MSPVPARAWHNWRRLASISVPLPKSSRPMVSLHSSNRLRRSWRALTKSANGCARIIRADDPALVDTVRALTDGAGVAAVYDSVGRDTFFQSLD